MFSVSLLSKLRLLRRRRPGSGMTSPNRVPSVRNERDSLMAF